MIVAIEGIDGAGKHTQTLLLERRLRAAGYDVGVMAFPRYGKTMMAEAVADYLNGRFGPIEGSPPLFPALLFAGDRFESRGLIEAQAAAHDVLLIDRYVASNLAHQGAKAPEAERKALIDWIARLEYTVYGLPRPDVTIYLDIPVATAVELIARKKPRDYTDAAADLHEANTAYLAACRSVYQEVGHTDDGGTWRTISCVDAEGAIRAPSEIAEDVAVALAPFIEAPA